MVTHCICHDVSFARLVEMANAQGLALAELKARTGCCTGCGSCEPYVRLALRTGCVRLPVLSPRECDEIMNPAGSKLNSSTPT